MRAPVSSPRLFSFIELGSGVPSHSYYAVNAKQRGIDLEVPSGDVLAVFSMVGAYTLTSGQGKVLTVRFHRLPSARMAATSCPSSSYETKKQ